MGRYADDLRWLYRSGRPNRFARLQKPASAAVYAPASGRAAWLPWTCADGRADGSSDAKPAILRRYLDVAPGARPHVPVHRRAPQQAFEEIVTGIPVFRITARP